MVVRKYNVASSAPASDRDVVGPQLVRAAKGGGGGSSDVYAAQITVVGGTAPDYLYDAVANRDAGVYVIGARPANAPATTEKR